ncbi:TauD/TfdA dioxygenase family protein [Methylosinus sporium]|uniref:TauD/TfdA dioxygenase family protein n=1 Tax=Methylosinus sporium TaxID=428 RepID=UPI000D595D86|nr:TauD/TfdA family dioxygenase [Methylosinus sporium]PWB88620.1 taurine catabolism dioxygenase [Methylocystis sp. MitZ-2018]
MNAITIRRGFEVFDLTPRIGSSIEIDVAALMSGEYAAEIRDLLERRCVIVFPRLDLDDAQHLALSRTLGEIVPLRADGLLPITLDRKVDAFAAEYLKGSFFWHFDGASDDIPARAAILNAKRLSPAGGQTEFSNCYAAWEELPVSVKSSIEGLRVVHSVEGAQRLVNPTPTEDELRRWRSHEPKTHPLVWTHKSGRKSLALGCTASHIEGLTPDVGSALLAELTEWATSPRFVYRHEWSVGDLLIWDNAGTLHRVTPYDAESGRLMTRTTIAGEEALV